MTDIIQEVAEDIKTEKFLHVIKNFTKIFVSFSMMILLITSIVVYRNYKYEQKQLAFSVDYFRLINTNPETPGYSDLYNKVALGNSESYAPMSVIHHSKALIIQKKYDEALKLLVNLYNNEENDVVFRNISRVLVMSTLMSQDFKDFRADNELGRSDIGEPFYGLIKLLYVQVLLSQNQDTEARNILVELVGSSGAFDNINSLASVMLSDIGN
jgi:hypothetical protein